MGPGISVVLWHNNTSCGVRQTWIQILPLTLTSFVALDKLHNLLEPHFLYL